MSKSALAIDYEIASDIAGGQRFEGFVPHLVASEFMRASDKDERILPFITTTDDPHRNGNRVITAGLDTRWFKTNPVLLLGHLQIEGVPAQLPMGRWEEFARIKLPDGVDGMAMRGHFCTPELFPSKNDWYDLAESVYLLCLHGYLNTTSIGWLSKAGKTRRYRLEDGRQGIQFDEAELMEASIAVIPANRRATKIDESMAVDLHAACSQGVLTADMATKLERIVDPGAAAASVVEIRLEPTVPDVKGVVVATVQWEKTRPGAVEPTAAVAAVEPTKEGTASQPEGGAPAEPAKPNPAGPNDAPPPVIHATGKETAALVGTLPALMTAGQTSDEVDVGYARARGAARELGAALYELGFQVSGIYYDDNREGEGKVAPSSENSPYASKALAVRQIKICLSLLADLSGALTDILEALDPVGDVAKGEPAKPAEPSADGGGAVAAPAGGTASAETKPAGIQGTIVIDPYVHALGKADEEAAGRVYSKENFGLLLEALQSLTKAINKGQPKDEKEDEEEEEETEKAASVEKLTASLKGLSGLLTSFTGEGRPR